MRPANASKVGGLRYGEQIRFHLGEHRRCIAPGRGQPISRRLPFATGLFLRDAASRESDGRFSPLQRGPLAHFQPLLRTAEHGLRRFDRLVSQGQPVLGR